MLLLRYVNRYQLLMVLVLIILSAYSLAGEEKISILYYGETGCGHCDLFEKKILPCIEEQTGVSTELKAFDIMKPEYYEECGSKLEKMGIEFTIFPVLFVGNNAYLGNHAVESGLFKELTYYRKNGDFLPFDKKTEKKYGAVSLNIIPVFIAGAIDGINPCAFAALVFFISFLSAQSRTRREILLTGILFTLSVFLTYLFLGFGLLNAVRSIVNFSIMRFILKIAVSITSGVFLVLSLYDYNLARLGKTGKIKLQLPLSLKKKIHRTIRRNNRNKFFAGGVIITGFTVSVIELACTGQVYLPTIAYMINTDNSFLGIQSLLVYNTGFILPLAAVFTAAYKGVSSRILSTVLTNNIQYAKILLAVFFMFMAIIIWII